MKSLSGGRPRRILVRGTNWVGDAVMTLPALAALVKACPEAELEVLAKPWVAPLYAAQPGVSRVLDLDTGGRHQGTKGRLLAAAELRERRYDWAVLFQNAMEAAILAYLARIPVRLGYATDGRGILLTHAVPRPRDKRLIHETSYYLGILHAASLLPGPPPREGVRPHLEIAPADRAWAGEMLASRGLDGPLLGLAPGASFGPAKCWPAPSYARAAGELAPGRFQAVLIFGSAKEAGTAQEVEGEISGVTVLNLAGATGLGQALALLERLTLFLTNDSGLMHAAAALGTPTLAVFGSTNPVTTSPLGRAVSLVRVPVECSPCLKPECPRGEAICLTAVTPEMVVKEALGLLDRAGGGR